MGRVARKVVLTSFIVRSSLYFSLGLALCSVPTLHASWWNPVSWFQRDEMMNFEEQDIAAQPLMRRARAEFEAGDYDEAGDLTKRLFRRYPLSRTAAEALYLHAQARYEAGRYTPAYNAAQQIVGRFPEFPYFNRIIQLQFEIALAEAEGRKLHFLFFFPYRKYNTAIAHFEGIVINAPYNELAPLALMNVARIHQFNNDTIGAIGALDRMVNLYPNGALTDDAYFELGSTFQEETDGPLYDQGATRESINYYRDYLILYPEEMKVAEAEAGLTDMLDLQARSKLVLGKYFLRYRKDYIACSIFLNEAITLAPDSEAAAEARSILEDIAEPLAEAEAQQAARRAAATQSLPKP